MSNLQEMKANVAEIKSNLIAAQRAGADTTALDLELQFADMMLQDELEWVQDMELERAHARGEI